MIARCDHPPARWHLVEADNKRWARVKVVETVCSEIEAAMVAAGMELPAVGVDPEAKEYA
jgi:hypothetical protein